MTTLFDIRVFAQSNKRFLHLSDPRGAYLGTVKAQRAPGIAGVLDETGELVVPDRAAFVECLPHRWRKAFERAGGIWWRKDEPKGSVTLHGARGQLIGTIYVTVYQTKH